MAGDLKKQIRQVGGDVEGRIENAGREVDGAIRTAGREIDKTFEDRIPEIAQKAIREFASAVTKQGLKKFRNMVRAAHESMQQIADRRPDLVDALDQPGVTFKLGPLTLEWSGFYSRAEGLVAVLDTFVANPPKFRRGPLDCNWWSPSVRTPSTRACPSSCRSWSARTSWVSGAN